MAPAFVPVFRCEKCIGIFSCVQQLKFHFCVRRYSCIVCRITFSSRSLLQDHIQCSNHQARSFSTLRISPDAFWNLKNQGLIDKKFPINVITSRNDSTPSYDFQALSGSQDAFIASPSRPVQDSHVSSRTNEEAAREKEAPEVLCSYENTSLPHDSGESIPNSKTTVCQLNVYNQGTVDEKSRALCDVNPKIEITDQSNALCDVNEKVEITGQSTANDKSSVFLKSASTIPESSVINEDSAFCQGDVNNKSVPNRQDSQNSEVASINEVDHIGTSTKHYEDKTEFRKKNNQSEDLLQPLSRFVIPAASDKSPFVSQDNTNNVAITNTNVSASLPSLPGSSSTAPKCDGFSPEAVLSKQLMDKRQIEEKKTSNQPETEAPLTDNITEKDDAYCLAKKLVTNSMKRNIIFRTNTKALVAAWLRQSVSDKGNETKSDTSKTLVNRNRTASLKSFSSDQVQESKSYHVNHSKSKKLEKLRLDIEKEKAFANMSESDKCTESRIISFKVKAVPRRRANSVENESGAESSSPSSVEDIFDLMSTRDLKGQQTTTSKNPTLAKTSSMATKEKKDVKKLRIADSAEFSSKVEDSVKMNGRTCSPTGGDGTRDLKGHFACTTYQREASKNPTLMKSNNNSKAAEENENGKKLRVTDSAEISMNVEDSAKMNDKTYSASVGEKCQHITGAQNKLRLSENRLSDVVVKENESVDNSDVIFLYSSGKNERNYKAKKSKTSSYGTDQATSTSPKQDRKPGRESTMGSSSDKETSSGNVDNNRTQVHGGIKRSISLMDRIQANESLKRAYETPCPVIERKKQLQSRFDSDSSSDSESESDDSNSSYQMSPSSRREKSGSHHLSFRFSTSPSNSNDGQHKFPKRSKRDRSRSRENSKDHQPKTHSENRHSRKKIKSSRNSSTSSEEKRRLSRSSSSESEASHSSSKSRKLGNGKLHNRRPSQSRMLEVTPENESVDGKVKNTIIKRDIISQTNKNLIRRILSSGIKHTHRRERTRQCINNSSELLQKKEDSSICKSPQNYQDDLSAEEDGEVQEKDQEEKKSNMESLEAQIQNQGKIVNSNLTEDPVNGTGLVTANMDDSSQEHRAKGQVNYPGTVDGHIHRNGSENNALLSQGPSVCNRQESTSEIQGKSGDRNLIIQSDVIKTKPCEEEISSDQKNSQSVPEIACLSSVATDVLKSVATDVQKSVATDNVEPVSLDEFYPKGIVESKEFLEGSHTNSLGEGMDHSEEREKKTSHYGSNTESVKIPEVNGETSKAERDVNFNEVSNGDRPMNDQITESIDSDVQTLFTNGDSGCDTVQQEEEQVYSTHSDANDCQLSEVEKGKEFESPLQKFRTVDLNTEVVISKVHLCQSDNPEMPDIKGHIGECKETELTTLQVSDNLLTTSCRDGDGHLTTQLETDHQPSTSSHNNDSWLLLQTDQLCNSNDHSYDRKNIYTLECHLGTENFSCQNEYSDPMSEEDNVSDAGTVKSILLYVTDDEQVKVVTPENKLSFKCDKTTSYSSFSTSNDDFSLNQGSEISSTPGLQTNTSVLPKKPAVQDKASGHIMGREESQSNLLTSDNRVSSGPQRRKTQLHRSTKDKMHSEKSKRRRSKARSDRKSKESKREPGRDPHLQKKKPMKRVEKKYIKYMTTHCPDCNTAFVLDEFMSVNLSTGDVSMKCPNCLMYTCMVGVVLNELKKICGRHKYSPKDPKCKVKLAEKRKGGEDKENLKSKHKSRSKTSHGGERQKEESKPRKTEDQRSKRRKEKNKKDKAVPPEGIAKADANGGKKILSSAVKRKTDHKADDGRKKVRTKNKEKAVGHQTKKCG